MSVPITGPVVPYPLGIYNTHYDVYGQGGLVSVADTTARNAIEPLRYKQGMLVCTVNDLVVYQAIAASSTGTNADWQVFTGGISIFSARESCRVATTGPLTATYDNNVTGVGATLTNADTQAAITIDGVALSASDRVLVKNQATAAENGIYTVTDIGSGATNWVLTRATDFDADGPSEIAAGAYTVIFDGTALPTGNLNTLWLETGLGPFTVGSTPIIWDELAVPTAGGTVTNVASGTGLTGGPITTTGTLALAAITSHEVMANTTSGSAAPAGVTLSSLIDVAISSDEGGILYRGASAWSALAPGADGDVLTTHGAAADPTWEAAGGAGTVTQVNTGTGLTGGPITATGTISLATIASDTVLANLTGGAAVPSAASPSAVLDTIGNTRGDTLYRGAGGWAVRGAGTLGYIWTSGGPGADPNWAAAGGGALTTPPLVVQRFGVFTDLTVAAQCTQITIMLAGGSFNGWRIGSLIGPTGADAIFDVLLSSDQGTTWTSLWASILANRPTIADGSLSGSGTAFDTTTYSAGDWLIGSIIQIGSTAPGRNVTLEIY